MLVEIIDIIKENTTKEVYIKDGIVLYSKSDDKVEQSIIDEATKILSDYKNKLHSNIFILECKQYLKDTDWYYARKLETGKEVPEDVVTKRLEARQYINDNGVAI